MNKYLKVLVVLVLSVIVLTGCKNRKEKKVSIVGKWAFDSYVYTFNEDKTCSYDAAGTLMKCTYEVDGDKLSILYDGNTAPFETTFSIDGKKLNIKDSFGNDTIYTKK